MPQIQNLLMHTETLKSLESHKKSLAVLADLSRQQGLVTESAAFVADIAHVEAKIQRLNEASET
jgi:hypothetical protein